MIKGFYGWIKNKFIPYMDRPETEWMGVAFILIIYASFLLILLSYA